MAHLQGDPFTIFYFNDTLKRTIHIYDKNYPDISDPKKRFSTIATLLAHDILVALSVLKSIATFEESIEKRDQYLEQAYFLMQVRDKLEVIKPDQMKLFLSLYNIEESTDILGTLASAMSGKI
jgi:hypothetical protein